MDERQFIGYEYRTLAVHEDMASVYADGYHHFGWEQEKTPSSASPAGMVTLKFKRDRKIRNKAELTRLQRQFDACAEELARLERSKTQKASIVACTVGLIGCAFMAGSVFAVTAEPPIIWLCALLAIPGFAGWIAPYFLYTRIRDEKTVTVNALIDKKYDEIYEVCEKANNLLGC